MQYILNEKEYDEYKQLKDAIPTHYELIEKEIFKEVKKASDNGAKEFYISELEEEAFLRSPQFVNPCEYGKNIKCEGEIGIYFGMKIFVFNRVGTYQIRLHQRRLEEKK